MTNTTITVEYNGTSYENVAAIEYNVVVMDQNGVVLHTDVDHEYTHPVTGEAVVIAAEETISQNPEGIALPDGVVELPDLIVKRIILGKSGQPSPVNSATYGYTYDSALNAFVPPKPTDLSYELELNTSTYEWEPKSGASVDLGDGVLRTYRSSDKSWQLA